MSEPPRRSRSPVGELVDLAGFGTGDVPVVADAWRPTIAALLVRLGDRERADRLAAAAGDPAHRVAVCCAMARAQHDSGDRHGASEVVRGLARQVAAVHEPSMYATALATLASTLVALGEVVKAARLVIDGVARTAAGAPDWCSYVPLLDTAAVAAEIGDQQTARALIDRALALSRCRSGAGWRGDALSAVSASLARIGELDEAASVAAEVEPPWAMAEALVALVHASHEAGDALRRRSWLDSAETAATRIDYGQWRSEAVSAVLTAHARIGAIDEAWRLMATLDDPLWRAESTMRVAAALTEAGRAGEGHDQFLDACQQANLLGYRWWNRSGDAVVEVAESLVRSGEIGRGTAVLHELRSTALRSAALERFTRCVISTSFDIRASACEPLAVELREHAETDPVRASILEWCVAIGYGLSDH